MERQWTEDKLLWLDANASRMDILSLSRALRIPVDDVERKLAERRQAVAAKTPATFRDAVRELSTARKEYERVIEHLRRKELNEAASCFARVLERHPDDKEMVDRARTYLAVARNGRKNHAVLPADATSLFHEAVFEKNRGNLARALEILRKVDGVPDPDGRFRYLAACLYALTDQAAEALASLKAAVAASAHNRVLARLDADLASVRGHRAFDEALSSS